MVRRCFARVVGKSGELRLNLLHSGEVGLVFQGQTHTFETLEDALDGAAWLPQVPGDLYEALAWELDLLALRGTPPG
ncbi:hypothetical protein K7W42_17545 [Deinococcus sp. HMF7604]|uniref:hypothetical protein n=1 Tax=Deinococcus betulae TaxID=2873312 RepID=UPI001CCC6A05|nr:hypothetical protein [Deinococcus betulae]MBZ9752650.1 hypothetical protein [Deinococcus betulae]